MKKSNVKYHVEFEIDFLRNPYKGLYIALEGVDGSGKTTQAQRITNYLRGHGKPVVLTREPRKQDGIIGELIQKILHGKSRIPPVAFQYLFSADREMHHEELVKPSLKARKIVVSDRCFWSSIPYGMIDRKAELSTMNQDYMLAAQSILSMYHRFIAPDLTFYLDLPLDAALDRIIFNNKKEIYEEKEKLAKIIEGYKWLIKEFPNEFILIDASKSVAEVTEEIIGRIEK